MITNSLETFIENILSNLNDLGIDVSKLEMDHFGYQASSKEDYDKLIKEVDTFGEIKSENIVGGRRVAFSNFLNQLL